MAKKTCLIVGAGELGKRVASLLDRRGYQVHTLNRNITKLPPHYHRHVLDFGSKNMGFDLPIEFERVFLTAAPDDHTKASYQRIYLQTLDQLKAILTRAKHVYFASSTGVYRQNNGEHIDESSHADPQRFSGKVMLQAEQWIAKNTQAHCIVRLSGLYSQNRSRIIRLLTQGKELDYARISNRIHLDDAAALFVHLTTLPQPEVLYLGSDNQPSTLWEIAQWYHQQTKQVWKQPKPTEPNNKLIANTKIRDTGFTFTYPSFKEGLAACL